MSALRLVLVSFCLLWASSSGVAAQDNALDQDSMPGQENELGKAAYQRCAACHLADGAGVPGAFPALRENVTKLAINEAGRDYLIYTIRKGVSGALEVDGVTYRGVMPAVAADLDDESVAALLNYLVLRIAPGESAPAPEINEFTPFIATEISNRSKLVLDAHSQQGILALRAKAIADNDGEPPKVED